MAPPARSPTKEERDFIVTSWPDDLTRRQLSRKMGLTTYQIDKVLKQAGLTGTHPQSPRTERVPTNFETPMALKCPRCGGPLSFETFDGRLVEHCTTGDYTRIVPRRNGKGAG